MRALPVILALAAACNPSPQDAVGDVHLGDPTAVLPVDQAAPPLTLNVSAVVPGQTTLFTVEDATPGVRVYFVRGTGLGVSCPPVLAGTCLDISNPRVLGTARANALGVATLSLPVPAGLPIGATAWFQATHLPNPTAFKSGVVQRTAVEAPAPPDSLLIADTASNRIFEIDLQGGVLGSWASPVGGVRGVAWDVTHQDGFWVSGNADIDTHYKMDRTGAVIDALNLGGYPNQDTRGLDYWPNSTTGDMLVNVSWNRNNIQVVYGFLVSDGSRWLESSHYNNGFLSGFWGVAVTDQPTDVARWVTWSNGDLEHWLGSSAPPDLDVALGGAGLRGVDTSTDGDLWVVDAQRRIVHHLAADGTPVGTIPLPFTDPADISVVQ